MNMTLGMKMLILLSVTSGVSGMQNGSMDCKDINAQCAEICEHFCKFASNNTNQKFKGFVDSSDTKMKTELSEITRLVFGLTERYKDALPKIRNILALNFDATGAYRRGCEVVGSRIWNQDVSDNAELIASFGELIILLAHVESDAFEQGCLYISCALASQGSNCLETLEDWLIDVRPDLFRSRDNKEVPQERSPNEKGGNCCQFEGSTSLQRSPNSAFSSVMRNPKTGLCTVSPK